MECIMSFWDFCPKDRFYLVLVIFACIGLGYIIGTGGRWKRIKGVKTSNPSDLTLSNDKGT
jgi:hypothetical protein